MRFGIIAENPVELIGLRSGMVPEPMLEGYGAAFGRAVTVAAECGIFDALDERPMGGRELAERCGTHPRATEKLVDLLVGARYLRRSRDGTYRLSKLSKRWLAASSPHSVRDMVLMKDLEWRWIDRLGSFVRSGEPLDVHASMSAEDWGLYQRGMRAQAGLAASWLARRLQMPAGATAMLDIGGSHGYFSVEMCRKHPDLRATVLDLPAAVEHAAPLLAAEGMGDRVMHRAGDVLTDDLGTDTYDLILAFSLVHHFDAETNRALAVRCAAALRPGGIYVIGDLARPKSPPGSNSLDLFYDLYFALTSRSGLWSTDEMAEWQRGAGLVPHRPMRLIMGQGPVLQVGERPRSESAI